MQTPDMSAFVPNQGKKLIVETSYGKFARNESCSSAKKVRS